MIEPLFWLVPQFVLLLATMHGYWRGSSPTKEAAAALFRACLVATVAEAFTFAWFLVNPSATLAAGALKVTAGTSAASLFVLASSLVALAYLARSPHLSRQPREVVPLAGTFTMVASVVPKVDDPVASTIALTLLWLGGVTWHYAGRTEGGRNKAFLLTGLAGFLLVFGGLTWLVVAHGVVRFADLPAGALPTVQNWAFVLVELVGFLLVTAAFPAGNRVAADHAKGTPWFAQLALSVQFFPLAALSFYQVASGFARVDQLLSFVVVVVAGAFAVANSVLSLVDGLVLAKLRRVAAGEGGTEVPLGQLASGTRSADFSAVVVAFSLEAFVPATGRDASFSSLGLLLAFTLALARAAQAGNLFLLADEAGVDDLGKLGGAWRKRPSLAGSYLVAAACLGVPGMPGFALVYGMYEGLDTGNSVAMLAGLVSLVAFFGINLAFSGATFVSAFCGEVSQRKDATPLVDRRVDPLEHVVVFLPLVVLAVLGAWLHLDPAGFLGRLEALAVTIPSP